MIYNIILKKQLFSTLLSENYFSIRPRKLKQPEKLWCKVNKRQNQQIITRWTPSKFDKKWQEIIKKERQNGNGQTNVWPDSFQRYWWSKNLGIQVRQMHITGQVQQKLVVSSVTLMTDSIQKTRIPNYSFQRNWWLID